MALHADWGNTPAYTEFMSANPEGNFVDGNGYPQSPIGTLVFAMMVAQFGSINEQNAHKVFARLSLYFTALETGFERVWDGNEIVDVALTPAHIKRAMNLKVNVTTEPDTKWVDYFLRLVSREKVSPVEGINEWTKASVKNLLKKYEAQYIAHQ